MAILQGGAYRVVVRTRRRQTMRSFLASSGLTLGPLGLGLAVAALSTLMPARADAHFILDKAPDGGTIAGEPACYSEQASDGTPEKSAPCGQDDTGITTVPTNIVTSFTPGADGTTTITFTTDEVVFHPGHYRVAIASDMNSLAADPAVTAGGGMACGTAAIETVPAGTVSADGVLADDVLDHTTEFPSPQSYTFKVPASVHCSPQCVLQVVEFMSDHPLNPQGGCFYHHCANISIVGSGHADGGAGEPDAGIGGSGSSSGAAGAGGASGSSTTGVSGTAASGTGASGTASSGTTGSGSSGNGSGSTGSTGGTGSAAGSAGSGGSSGSGASSGTASSGSSGTTASGTAGSGNSGSGTSTGEASGGSSSSGGCAVAKAMTGGDAPGLRLGVFALAALVFLRRRTSTRKAHG
jgi:hypothetical protein